MDVFLYWRRFLWRGVYERPDENKNYKAEKAEIVGSIEKAIKISRNNSDEEIFIIGGGEIYKDSFKFIDKLYITEIKAKIEGSTYFPNWDRNEWTEISRINHPSDKIHKFEFDFVILKRNEWDLLRNYYYWRWNFVWSYSRH